jgi:hypothetical protein
LNFLLLVRAFKQLGINIRMWLWKYMMRYFSWSIFNMHESAIKIILDKNYFRNFKLNLIKTDYIKILYQNQHWKYKNYFPTKYNFRQNKQVLEIKKHLLVDWKCRYDRGQFGHCNSGRRKTERAPPPYFGDKHKWSRGVPLSIWTKQTKQRLKERFKKKKVKFEKRPYAFQGFIPNPGWLLGWYPL